jgi:hypothetical protein
MVLIKSGSYPFHQSMAASAPRRPVQPTTAHHVVLRQQIHLVSRSFAENPYSVEYHKNALPPM